MLIESQVPAQIIANLFRYRVGIRALNAGRRAIAGLQQRGKIWFGGSKGEDEQIHSVPFGLRAQNADPVDAHTFCFAFLIRLPSPSGSNERRDGWRPKFIRSK